MIEPNILPGFMELLPAEQITFNKFVKTIQSSYELFGFLPIDTPIIEKAEVLLAKGGEETEKQTYTFKKGENDLALRFDLTVPLARYVSQRQQDLSFPFKRYQIGKVYRGEKPQKGRFREFYQCDADVIGREILPMSYDAELVSLIYFTFHKLNIGEFLIRISNRKLISGYLEALGLGNIALPIIRLTDKVDKISDETYLAELAKIGVPKTLVGKILEFINIKGTPNECVASLEKLNIQSGLFKTGLEELTEVIATVTQLKVPQTNWLVDLRLIRGLDYYTGTIYETVLTAYPQLGSVCGGGRYDNLASYYTNQKLPGVGISIGLTRVFSQLKELGALDVSQKSTTQILILPMDSNYIAKANTLASILRQDGINTEVYTQESNLSKKLTQANKHGIPLAAIIGADEVATESITIKNMSNSSQETVLLTKLLNYLADKI